MNRDLTGRRIALIGGAGFIGHHLALKLRDLGAEVNVLDSLNVNNLLWFAGGNGHAASRDLYMKILNERLDLLREADVKLITQDARDYHALTDLLKSFGPDTVVQLAAVAHANRANKDPFSTFDHSLRTLENALDYSRGNVERFVFYSSSMAYGNFESPVVTEQHPLNPMGIYGALKASGEQMVRAYGQTFGLPYTIVRPSALYGPRCVSRRVTQVFIENALRGQPLTIQGDGEEKLDFTYIEDLIQGVSLAIGKEEARNETFNMTHGAARSINELAAIVQEHIPGVEITHEERDNMMPFRGTLSIDKARERLGYEPAYPIERGVPAYIDWYKTVMAPGLTVSP